VPPTLSAEDLAGLVRKYVEIRRLRLQAERDPSLDPRRQMAALAAEFPGALREADELPMDEIDRRLVTLDRVAAGHEAAPAWMSMLARFHALTRGALCAKKWLAGRKEVDDATERAFTAEVGTLCYASDAREWSGELARLAKPPRGRVTDVVFERLARELGVEEGVVRGQVLGAGRRPVGPSRDRRDTSLD